MATATIVSITGQAWARDEAGNLRELSIGDVLQEGETLITSSNGSVELDFADGTGVSRVEGGQEVVVTPDLVSDLIVATDASVQDDDLEALLAALDDEDGDLLDLLDATAAGGAGVGGGGGGSDFVRLARIAEETDSLSFETSGGLGEGEFIDFGGAPDADTAEADEPEPSPEPNTSPTITVTAAGAFNENDAQVGTVVATFTASDEEDGVLTVANGGVAFTPGTNGDGYYAFDGENVTLTQAGVDAINAGTTLPPVSLTATDSGGLTATDSDTPTYAAQNDGPTIDVTAVAEFNENDAVVGQTVATFTASDEEDGTLTVGNGGVAFTPGTNGDGYYAFDGENVTLTQAGVDAINAGTTLPPVSLTATDSGGLTATDSDTPTYAAQNDGPTIDVTAVDTFNENDAVVGQTVATFTASDEEDGVLTAGAGQVTFTPGTNGDGYYAFDGENVTLTQAGVDAINAGTTLPPVSLTATDSGGLTATDSDTPTYNAQNDGPTIDVTAVDTFNENDAVVGQTVATFTASDEEDGVLTVANGGVAFTPGTNGDGYYAFDGENVTLTQAGVDAINAGTTLPPVSLTATDSGGLTATDSDTPTYAAQNDGPTIDVTAVDTFNENDAVVGQTVATFTASDEEDGTLTVGNGGVAFTPGTNGDGYYAFDGENVTLTQAGVDAINAGTTLPPVSLTATDSGGLTATDSDTPTYAAQNDGPTIDVTAVAEFNENDAVVGQTVATFTASDEEDGVLTAGAGQVTFTPGSNGDGYYVFDGENVTLTQAGVDAINAGTTLPPVSLTASDSGGLTATDSDTPTYAAQNDGPTIDVTAVDTFNENDAVVGQTVATFTASDEEDGVLTAGAGQVTFTPGTNGDGYYAFDGENVTLTQAGVDAINAGTTLPPVSLTATDSGGLTATDSDTPTYAAQNDGPTIDVTAVAEFNENDAVVGQTVATFTASDEEDGVLTAGAGQVTFTPGSNGDGYYAFDGENVTLTQAGVDAINAGTTLPPVSLTATDSGGLTATDSDTPTYAAQNDGPTIDVTAVDTFNENDAVVGQTVATFTASDEEDGVLTVANGGVGFTPGTNGDGYYAFDGENVTLTQAGVDAINAGTTLPPVSLTATDSGGLTATDSDTPTYAAQNDGPTIDVTAVDTFNENDAVVGQTVATFTASDEEDGVLTAGAGQVTFTPGTNGDGYYAFDGENVTLTQAGVDAINAGTTLPPVSLTATDSGGLTATDSDTPSYVINSVVAISEEGLDNGIPDTGAGADYSDTTNSTTASGTLSIAGDTGSSLTVGIDLTSLPTGLASGGEEITWDYLGGNQAIAVGSTSNGEVIRIELNDGNTSVANPSATSSVGYEVTLSAPVDHPENSLEDTLNFDFDVNIVDGNNASSTGTVTVVVEDDMPIVNADTNDLNVVVNELAVGGLSVAWSNVSGANGGVLNNQPAGQDDVISWGGSNGKSNYTFDDNDDLIANNSVSVNSMFELGEFTHNNFVVSQSINSVDLDLSLNILINGYSATIKHTINFDHNETSNSGADPRDIVTIKNASTIVPVEITNENGEIETYNFQIIGFVDQNNNIVSNVFTNENASNSYKLMAKLVSSDAPDVSGQLEYAFGADGPSDEEAVVWNNGNGVSTKENGDIEVQGKFGILTVSEDGSYTYKLDQGAYDQLDAGEKETESFTYTLTDGDGDSVKSALDINITGEAAPLNPNNVSIGTNAGETVESKGGDDLLIGDQGGKKTVIEKGQDYNISLMLDASQSMSAQSGTGSLSRFQLAKNALKSLVDDLSNHDGIVNVQLLAFSDSAWKVSEINGLSAANVKGLKSQIDSISQNTWTNYEDAFIKSKAWFDKQADSDSFKDVAYFLTDGDPTAYNHNSGNVKTTGGYDTNKATMEKAIEAFSALKGVDVHAIGIGGGVSQNLLEFFDNTGLVIENDSVRVNGGKVYGSTGKVDIVNSAEDLQAVLQGGSEREEPADVGNDILRGSDGDNIIFGDALEHADYPGMGVQGIKNYLQAENGAEPSDEALAAFIRENHESLVMPTEQGGDDVLIGGAGNDVLYGGAGADTFAWEFGDQGTANNPAEDQVMDFQLGEFGVDNEADRLDLADLLQDEDSGNIDDYIFAEQQGDDTVLHVKSDGGLTADGSNADQHIVLKGVEMPQGGSSSDFIQSMLDNDQLKIDQ